MSTNEIARNLVAKTPLELSQHDTSPSAALKHTQKTIDANAAAQTQANRSVGGRRKRSRKSYQKGGGIVIPQPPASGGSSKDAAAGMKQNFSAIVQAGSDSQYDNEVPKVGGKRRKRRRRTKKRDKSRKRRKSRKRKSKKRKRKSKKRRTRKR
jgi:hypothetical protein